MTKIQRLTPNVLCLPHQVVLRRHQLVTSGSPWRTRNRLSHSGRERHYALAVVIDSGIPHADRAEPYSTDVGKVQDYDETRSE
jgi:hypothetical protein